LKPLWEEAQKLTSALSRSGKTVINSMGPRSCLIVTDTRGFEVFDWFHALPSQVRMLHKTVKLFLVKTVAGVLR